MKEEISQITRLVNEDQLEQAHSLISGLLKSKEENEEFYFQLGRIHYKRQEWGEAINAFNKVLDINPNHKEAQSLIEMAKNILGYFTPDMFNP